MSVRNMQVLPLSGVNITQRFPSITVQLAGGSSSGSGFPNFANARVYRDNQGFLFLQIINPNTGQFADILTVNGQAVVGPEVP